MTAKEIIKLGNSLGLPFHNRFGRSYVVFDGCNGQRFVIEEEWSDRRISHELGKALILYGRRLQKLEISRALSITEDYDN